MSSRHFIRKCISGVSSFLLPMLLALAYLPNAYAQATALNNSFEAPSLGAAFQYNPVGASWSFSGASGIQGNGSAWGAPLSIAGTQTAFIQNQGSISQTINVVTAGPYNILFVAAQRACCGAPPYSQQIKVMVDGVEIGRALPSSTTSYSNHTFPYVFSAGIHTITFAGTVSSGDNTAFIDAVQINSSNAIIIQRPNFEAPVLNSAYQYNPSDAGWIFTGASGIQGNGSAWGAPNAPGGSQTAFVQNQGSFSQVVNFPAQAGAYNITFLAAQRACCGAPPLRQQIKVSIDGVEIGRASPSSTTSYQTFTYSFTVPAGAHTVAFAGTVTSGDASAFIDTVSITPSQGLQPIKVADCLTNVDDRFIAHDTAAGYYPATPLDKFYLVVRHMGVNSVSTPITSDFGSLGATPITNFHPPAPYGSWQRGKADSNANYVSGFQMHCRDVGSFINTWTFPFETIIGGGPHSFYSYDFSIPHPTFDANPATELVYQVSMEIPWFVKWDSGESSAVGQVSMGTYLRDKITKKQIAYIFNIFDNRSAEYTPNVQHDTNLPFISTPLRTNKYLTLPAESAVSTNQTWVGLRLFQARISQAKFKQAINDVNAFCAQHRTLKNCEVDYSTTPANYEMVSFGVLHEVFRSPSTNVSMGVHLQSLGVYLAR
jgi:hypothetical protein